MFLGIVMNWINNLGESVSQKILYPILNLPGSLKAIALVAIAFLTVVGLIRVLKKALKTVVSIATIFVVLVVLWLIIR